MNSTLKDALDVARLLWPRFEERDGAVIAVDFVGEGATPVSMFPSRTEAEILLNHVHILDCFANSVVSDKEPFYDANHPDFKRACALGVLIAQSWAAKLHLDYPERTFRVFYTQQDNPIVRFHQLRSGEPQFLDEEDWSDEVKDGRVVIHKVPAAG